MGFLELNLYGHSSRAAFDPQKVLTKVKESFPEAVFVPGDQAVAEVQRAEGLLAEELRKDPKGPASKVIASLRRKAQSYGPTYAFTIRRPERQPIQGLARSVSVGFLFEEPLSDETRQRLVAFLTSLGVGRLRASTNDRQQADVLADLQGPSACLRDQPGVPWQHPNPQPAGASEAP